MIISNAVIPKGMSPNGETGNGVVGLFFKIYTCKDERTQ